MSAAIAAAMALHPAVDPAVDLPNLYIAWLCIMSRLHATRTNNCSASTMVLQQCTIPPFAAAGGLCTCCTKLASPASLHLHHHDPAGLPPRAWPFCQKRVQLQQARLPTMPGCRAGVEQQRLDVRVDGGWQGTGTTGSGGAWSKHCAAYQHAADVQDTLTQPARRRVQCQHAMQEAVPLAVRARSTLMEAPRWSVSYRGNMLNNSCQYRSHIPYAEIPKTMISLGIGDDRSSTFL